MNLKNANLLQSTAVFISIFNNSFLMESVSRG